MCRSYCSNRKLSCFITQASGQAGCPYPEPPAPTSVTCVVGLRLWLNHPSFRSLNLQNVSPGKAATGADQNP